MHVAVPFQFPQLREDNKEALLRVLRKLDTNEVFVCRGNPYDFSNLEQVKKVVKFVEDNGYKVAVWTTTYRCSFIYLEQDESATKIHINGNPKRIACSMHEKFVDYCATAIASLAKAGFKFNNKSL
jgi:hypothetical protein